MQDLITAAVVDAQVHLAAVIVRALFLGRVHQALQLRREPVRSPKKRILNLSRSMIESASFMYLSKMFMIVRTSSGGRRQFSVEKGVDREVFDADGLTVVADAAKRLGAVSVTGRARQTALFAQRPLPSRMIATWRGRREKIHLRRCGRFVVCHNASCAARTGALIDRIFKRGDVRSPPFPIAGTKASAKLRSP